MPYVDKFIVTGQVLKAYPGSVGGTEVNVSSLIQSASVRPKRATVPTAAMGDPQDYTGKAQGQHEVAINLMHDKALTVLLPFLVAELAKDTATPFQLQLKDAAKAVGNPYITFSANVADIGNLGGDRGAVMGAQVTWQINGPVTIDDGTTVVTL